MATGFPVKANYATGDVLTAANMNDLSGTVNYLQYMPPRNPVINSNFSVWQRGTSIATAANTSAYSADRWQVRTIAANMANTVSRQATGDTTNLPNIQYCARVQRNSGQTGTSLLIFEQSMESVNSIPFSGKSVTFSFYARAGANFSAASSVLNVALVNGTGTDQNVSGYTGSNNVIVSTATLTTTWQRFTFTGTIPTNSTELAVQTYYTTVGTASTNDYFEITGVQLELGSAANTYMPNQPTYQAELAACQRYYRRWTAGTTYGTLSMFGTGLSTTQAICAVPIQTMRVAPTSVDYANINAGDGTNSYAVTALSINQGNENAIWLLATTASGLVQYRPTGLVGSNNTAGYVGLSAEL